MGTKWRIVVAATTLLALSGCASIPASRWSAVAGQSADSITTVVGLAAGFAEGNPVVAALPVLLLVKPFMPRLVHWWSDDFYSCRNSLVGSAHIGWGAAIWNVGVMLGAPAVGAIVAVGSGFLMHGHRTASAGLYCIDKPDPNASETTK